MTTGANITEKLPVRFSHLKAMQQSPAHALYAMMEDAAPSRTQDFGTTTHALLFNTQTVVRNPFPQRRGKEFEAWAVQHDGCRIVTAAEWEESHRMADSVRRHPKVRDLELLKGIVEKTHLFQLDGRLCRATPDVRTADRIVDLKTTKDASVDGFYYEMLRYKYHAGGAWYRHACEMPEAPCYLIAVENSEPFVTTVFSVPEHMLQDGEMQCVEWFARLRECERAGYWPAYSEDVVELKQPEARF